MFKDSRISLGKSRVLAVNVSSQDESKACIAQVTIGYIPFKREREWLISFTIKSDKVAVAQLLDYLYERTALHTEILGLGSWLPLIDNIKYALGLNLIKVEEADINVLEPYSQPKVVK